MVGNEAKAWIYNHVFLCQRMISTSSQKKWQSSPKMEQTLAAMLQVPTLHVHSWRMFVQSWYHLKDSNNKNKNEKQKVIMVINPATTEDLERKKLYYLCVVLLLSFYHIFVKSTSNWVANIGMDTMQKHHDTSHNDIQHNNNSKLFMLSVIMLSVIMPIKDIIKMNRMEMMSKE